MDTECPLLYLKEVLGAFETSKPDYFKEIVAALSPQQLETLLLAIKHSEEYTARVREEIAKIAGRSVDEVAEVLGSARNLTARQREVLSLFSAGCTYAEIDKVCGNTRCRPGAAAASIVTALRKRGGELGYRQHGLRSHEARA